MLNVIAENLKDVVVLRCAGRIVRGEETPLLCAASQLHGRMVMVDLEKVEAIDAAGVGLLVSLQAAGIYLRLMNPNQTVREILSVTHLDSIFEIGGPAPAQEMPKGSPAIEDHPSQQGFRLTA